MSARAVPNVILFAEDDPSDVFLLERVVKRYFADHQLRVVSDGDEAVRYLEGTGPYQNRAEHPFPRLVLMDINLPRKSGLEVLAWIRQQPRLQTLVVLILTGSDSEEHLRRAYELHANSFLKKRPLLLVPQVSRNILDYWLNLNRLPQS
jgi:CheY-like chemotaxis protein